MDPVSENSPIIGYNNYAKTVGGSVLKGVETAHVLGMYF